MNMMRRTLTFFFLLLSFAAPAAAQTSWGMGVMRNGTIVFCDRLRNTVWQVDAAGQRTAALNGMNCYGVATGLDGQVVGESTPLDLVMSGKTVGVWRLGTSGQREWLQPPAWLARDAQSRSYIWMGIGAGSPTSEIVRLEGPGITVTVAGGARGKKDGVGAAAAFNNVTGIAAAPDGSVLVIDDGSIRRIDSAGSVVTEAVNVVTDSHFGITDAPGLWAREIGIAADHNSQAVVVDPAAGRVVHVDRGGHAVTMWAPSGWSQRMTGGRWGWRPSGVAMLGRTYYVVDEWLGPAIIADLIGSPRVTQVDEQGRVTRIASVPGWTARIGGVLLIVVLLSLIFRKRK